MKYLLFYTDSCCPKIKSFRSFLGAKRWAGRFLLKHQDNQDDFWVDMIVRGTIKSRYSNWAREADME